MPRKRYQVATPKPAIDLSGSIRLPTDRPIAVYYRQSTEAQIGNVSTTMQTVDMVEFLKARGWNAADIILIRMDAGVSGTTTIEERPGMKYLYELITAGKIGGVACQDEDRLFRDITQIQVNIFIEACRVANVLVLTPSMVYDFANEFTGSFHARQFRFKSEMAADYINTVIRGKLQKAKQRLLLEGRWAGPGMPPGYMADIRRKLPDHSENVNWRRFEVFEPYAEVVREYYRLFLSHAGQVRTTVGHIEKYGPYFPDPQRCQPPEGYRVVYRIRQVDGHYYPRRSGLREMLSNAQYIGHWMYRGGIVRWNNHPPIIDESTFFRAFNYLSNVTLDGGVNGHYAPVQQNARPSLEDERPMTRPLCAGLMVTQDQGEWRTVGTNWVSPFQHYAYTFWTKKNSKYCWGRKAEDVDVAILKLVRDKVSHTFDINVWAETVEAGLERERQRQALHRSQLEEVKLMMDNLITSLGALTNTEMILAAQQRYENAQREYRRLEAELANANSNNPLFEEWETIRTLCAHDLSNWEDLTDDEKRVILQAFITRIEATYGSDKSLRLSVRWKDNRTDEVLLPRRAPVGKAWTYQDDELLVNMVNSGASNVEIAAAFPSRTWGAIRQHYSLVRRENDILVFKRQATIRCRETIADYKRRMKET